MQFRTLGLLEVVDDDGNVAPVRGKESALLADLLLNANSPVTTEQLAEDIWGDTQPANAAKTVQIYVSRLRKLVGAGRLRTTPGGYVLETRLGEYDVEEFERCAEEGRRAREAGELEQAVRVLGEGLELWRGSPLTDFRFDSFAQAEIRRLEELRDGVVADLMEARLALGDADELLPELEALVRQNPLRERLRGLLMRCLYLCGRQAEALEVFGAGRAALVEELGVEPGRPLRELQQAILNQDPGLEPASPREQTRAEGAAAPPPPRPTAREVRKRVTAVFVGFVLASRRDEHLDPELLRRVGTALLRDLRCAAERHGGSLETIASDALTTVFGLPTVHEDDCRRAVRAALEMRHALADAAATSATDAGLQLDFRIGVSTGEVVTSADEQSQVRATGEPLIVAPQIAAAGAVALDDATRSLVHTSVRLSATENDAWIVGGDEILAATRAGRLVSPIVGRERERRRLHDAFAQAVSHGSCQLFTVLGVAGVGKSRLVQEFLDDLDEHALVARGRCLPYGEGITYWPLAEAVAGAVRVRPDEPPEQVRARLSAAFAGEANGAVTAERVASLLGLAESPARADDAFAAARALFESVARSAPLVLVFDDIHWAEPTFLDLLEYFAEWIREAPILLVCLARPELLDARPAWAGGKLDATTTLLEPLSPADCTQLIENLVGAGGLSDETRARIAGAADGNPLYVEEMLSMLIEEGLLVQDGDAWTASRDIEHVPVPPTIQALLAARLDQLEEDERVVIEAAAVGGKVFYEDAVATLVPADSAERVAALLGALLRKELIRSDRPSLGGRTFRFRHLLIRDAAYDAIPKEARAGLHERFADWLEDAAGTRLAEYEEVIGYHLEQAYRYRVALGIGDSANQLLGRRAAERLGSAGRRAFARSDSSAGMNLVSRAVTLLPAADALRVELVPNVRVVQGGAADMSWADRALTEAVEAAATSGDRGLAARALVQRALLRLFTASDVTPAELLDVAGRAAAVFGELGDDLGLARAHRLKAQSHYLDRRGAACAEASEVAFEHARRTGDPFENQEIAEWLEIALLLGPTPASVAAERLDRLVAETRDHPATHAGALAALGAAQAMLCRFADADRSLEQATAIVAERGESVWLLAFWQGWVHVWQQRYADADRVLRRACETLRAIGEKTHFTTQALGLADVAYLDARYTEVDALTQEVERAIRPNDVHSQILWRGVRAKMLARRGEHEAAEELAREGVAYASETDFLIAHGDAYASLAEVLIVQGDSAAAGAALEEAIGVYEAKEHFAGIGMIRPRLASLR